MRELKPWTLPLIVAAIAIPLIAGFLTAGPALGVALGFLAVATLVWIAVREAPRGPIETASADDERRHLLIVLSRALGDPAAIERIADGLPRRSGRGRRRGPPPGAGEGPAAGPLGDRPGSGAQRGAAQAGAQRGLTGQGRCRRRGRSRRRGPGAGGRGPTSRVPRRRGDPGHRHSRRGSRRGARRGRVGRSASGSHSSG